MNKKLKKITGAVKSLDEPPNIYLPKNLGRAFRLLLILLLIVVAVDPVVELSISQNAYSAPQLAAEVGPNAIYGEVGAEKLAREEMLREYLVSWNSPMANSTDTFIRVADENDLDWRLLPAIAGVESGFGKALLQGSYNPFGWGGGYLYFESWDHAIETVGQGLAQNYPDPKTPEVIGPIYAPPSYFRWIPNVNYFMGEISGVEATSDSNAA